MLLLYVLPTVDQYQYYFYENLRTDATKTPSLSLSLFIRLHITAQSGPIIRVRLLCHSHWSSQGGINDTCYESLRSDATRVTYYIYSLYLSPERLVLLCPLTFYSPDILGRHLMNQHSLVYAFPPLRPSLPCFPRVVHRIGREEWEGIQRSRPQGSHQNIPSQGWECVIP